MKYQMVLQWTEDSMTYEKLIEIEDTLESKIGVGSAVDGHDLGAGQCNIYLVTNDPHALFEQLLLLLNESDIRDAKIAYRQEQAGDFSVLWPDNNCCFKII